MVWPGFRQPFIIFQRDLLVPACLLPATAPVTQMFSLGSQQQVWTQPVGGVYRTNYNNNEDMSGVIAPKGALTITLQFTVFQTESNYDFVTIKSCTTINCLQSSVLGRYSGSTIPSPVTSNTGIMMIQWSSDFMVISSGWSAVWNSVPVFWGGTIFVIWFYISRRVWCCIHKIWLHIEIAWQQWLSCWTVYFSEWHQVTKA